MRHLYSALFYFILPFIFIRLWWKGRKNPGYRKRWWERLGFIKPLPISGAIWVHAVSLGEMVTARPLIQAIRKQYPETPVIITNMTATGAALAEQYADPQIYYSYVPYDLPGITKRFLKRAKPSMLIIMETELWPNLIYYTAQKNIPILLANARLSERSMRGYQRIQYFIRSLLSKMTIIAAQTQEEASRFIALGAKPENVFVSGSIKFDIPLPEKLIDEGKALRRSWGAENRPVLCIASTHRGEEEKILQAFSRIKQTFPNILLILVPRHPERFDEVAKLCQKFGYSVIRRSEKKLCDDKTDIFLGDSFGELFLYYAASDIAFVGGSFAEVGGHNLLEPAALGLPVTTGPCVFNFKEIFAKLEKEKAVIQVQNEHELSAAWQALLSDKKESQEMGARAKQVVLQNRGALEKHMQYVSKLQ